MFILNINHSFYKWSEVIMRKFIWMISSIFIILIIIFSIYKSYSISDIPYNSPKVKISYDNKKITSSQGEHNWINGEGGNSYLAGSSYEIGKKLEAIKCTASGYMDITFKTKPINCPPQKLIVSIWKDKDNREVYQEIRGDISNSVTILLPEKEGEYIFEINAYWDDKHNTSNILKILIE